MGVHVGSGVQVGAIVAVGAIVGIGGALEHPTTTIQAATNPTPTAKACGGSFRMYATQDCIRVSISPTVTRRSEVIWTQSKLVIGIAHAACRTQGPGATTALFLVDQLYIAE